MKQQTREIKISIIGGLIAQIAFEAYSWLISPLIFGTSLQPAKLVRGLTEKYIGLNINYEVAFVLHTLIGIIGFGIFTLLFYKAFRSRAVISGFISGLVLWFIAQGILAPAVGREFMMSFGPYTQSSFISHVGMTMIIAFFISSVLKKPMAREFLTAR